MSNHLRHLLAIDASTSRASVALYSKGVWYEERVEATAQQAQLLLPIIDRLLGQAGLLPQQLEGVIFGRGPGSFTGLRIACSIAKGLAYAHDVPIFPVSSLLAIAQSTFEQEEKKYPILAAIDARMNQLYWSYYPDMNQKHSPEYVTNAEEMTLPLESVFILAGVGLHPYEKLIPQTLWSKCLKSVEVYPDARTLISLVKKGGIEPVEVTYAAPIYVRNNVTHGESRG